MKIGNSKDFQTLLTKRIGIDKKAVSAAWPSWWSAEAEDSASAQAELRFSVSKKLGLDPRSILSDEKPTWLWRDSSRFKGYSGNDDTELPAINSFGQSVARILLGGCKDRDIDPVDVKASRLRDFVLQESGTINLRRLLILLWSIGIPVVHLRVHPLPAKRMSAMAIKVQNRFVILLARDASFPAPTAFHLAHEIGHICLGHLNSRESVIDMKDISERDFELNQNSDNEDSINREEIEADRFALELLTGLPDLKVENTSASSSPRALAEEVAKAGLNMKIDPGILSMCYGNSSQNWEIAFASLRHIYGAKSNVWKFINKIASDQIQWNEISEDSSYFLKAILGGNQS